jgi:hypothetical protein
MTYFSSYSFFSYTKFGSSYSFWDKYFLLKKIAVSLKCGDVKPDPKPIPIEDCGCEPESLKVDFNGLTKGTIVSNQFEGVSIQALVTRDVCITVEAESMARKGFAVANGWAASGCQLVRLCDSKGTLSTTFSGPSSTYDVKLRVQDDCLGKSKIELKIDGKVVKTFLLDNNNHGFGSDHGGFNTVTLKGVTIPQGAKVELVAYRDGWEAVRIDSLTFVGTVTENRAMIVDTNHIGWNGPTELKNGDGKVLVISDGNASNPTDRTQGGKIEFAFDKLSIVTKLSVIDLEDGGKVQAYDENGNLIGTVTIGKQAKASVKCVDLNFDGVAKLVVTLNGRGAVDDLCYAPIPEEPDNTDPIAVADIAKLCANASVAIDVLKNDSDADGDALAITAIKVGDAFVDISEGGSVTLESGAVVTLTGGKLVYSLQGADDFDDLLIGQKATDKFAYQIADGNGGVATADVTVNVCGAKNTVETIAASLPAKVSFVLDIANPLSDLYTVTLSGSGDARLDGLVVDMAYCAARFLPINTGQLIEATVSAPTGGVYDAITWILNQDFGSKDNGDGQGKTYTDVEIQGAIWGFTDGMVYVNNALGAGTQANAVEIYNAAQAALADPDFSAGDDVIALLLTPTDASVAAGNKQPFVIGVAFDALAQDCLCDCLC